MSHTARALRLALFTDTWTPQVNGVSRTLERLAHAVKSRGGEVGIFTVDDPAVEEQHNITSSARTHANADDATFPVHRYPSVPFWAYDQLRLSWPSLKVARRDLQAFAPTLVHSATEFGVGMAGRRLAIELQVPFVSSYHTSFAAYAKFYRLGALSRPGWSFLRWFHNGGLRTYCPSKSIARELALLGFANTTVWSRGVDTVRFSPAYRSSNLRERLGATDDTLVVAYVGRLAAEKGLAVGLEALRIATQQRPDRLRFLAVGDGPFEREVERLAPAGSWMPGRLTGDALSAAYASADVFMFPSATDTFGNVLLEAMASGVPVLAADTGPSSELVLPDRGWLFPANSAERLASILVSLIDERQRVEMAGAASREFAKSASWDRIWEGLLADYLSLHRPSTDSPCCGPLDFEGIECAEFERDRHAAGTSRFTAMPV